MPTKRTNASGPTIPRGLRLSNWDTLKALCEEESRMLGIPVTQGALLGKALKHYAKLPLAVRVGLKEK